MTKLTCKDNNFYLKSEYVDRLRCKQIPGYQWVKAKKMWKYPFDYQTLKVILALFQNINVSDNIYDKLDQIEKSRVKVNENKIDFFNKNIDESFRNLLELPLHDHQLLSFNFFRKQELAADFSEPGAEKTAVQIALIKYRIIHYEIDKILIVCPKRIMAEVWQKDIIKFMYGENDHILPIILLDKPTDSCNNLLKSMNTGIFIVNYEKIWRLEKTLLNKEFDMLILDESHKIKTHSAKQSKFILKLNDKKFKSILTGTPSANSELDLFSQFKFLDPTLFGTSYYAFKDKYFFKAGFEGYESVLKPDAQKQIKALTDIYAVSWKKSECKDLPLLTEQNMYCELKGEQLRVYNEMQDNMIAFLNDTTYTAPIALTQVMRLVQITSGFLQKTEEHDLVIFKNNPKLKMLKELVESIPKNRKIIIWAHYRKDIELIHNNFPNQSLTYYGGIPDKQKDINKERFDTDKNIRILISNPASGGIGLNLSIANYSIYYSKDYSYINYGQSKERFNREGQKHKMTSYHLLVKDSIDEIILIAVQEKHSTNQLITDIRKMK